MTKLPANLEKCHFPKVHGLPILVQNPFQETNKRKNKQPQKKHLNRKITLQAHKMVVTLLPNSSMQYSNIFSYKN